MNKFFNKIKWIIVFIVVEVYFYLRDKPNNLEMFFMVWGFIFLALLLYNIFNIKSDSRMPILAGKDASNYANLSGAFVEKQYENKNSNKRFGGGLLDSTNLLYLFCLIGNIIGYIIVMPK